MKATLKFLAVLTAIVFYSCKNDSSSSNANGQGSVTESGKNIGADADSTTVDGPKGSISNN